VVRGVTPTSIVESVSVASVSSWVSLYFKVFSPSNKSLAKLLPSFRKNYTRTEQKLPFLINFGDIG